jgi:hypothetical protein
MQKTGVFILALLSSFGAVPGLAQTPSPSPSPTPVPNPFCAVHASARAPLHTADPEYRLLVNSSVAGPLSVHVTMVGDSGAYDAYLPDIAMAPGKSDFHLPNRTVVTLPAGADAKYVYVDSYAVAGGEKIACPTQPAAMADPVFGPVPTSPDATMHVAATFLQALPPMPCGKMYVPAHARGYSPRTGFWGNKELNAKVHVYIDSNGTVVQRSIYKSSGVPGVDDEAMGSAQFSTYYPATFLCTPVVGDYLFSFTYRP